MALVSGIRLGPYEIVAAIGAGGMGEVYRARDTRLDRTVAIKVVDAQLARDAQFRERFEREARVIAALTHPHILTLFDVGTEGDVTYAVMELVEGRTIRTILEEDGALAVRLAVSYALQIAQALTAAHMNGITHRDLKPENVMITRDGQVKVLDFGLAKMAAPQGDVSAFVTRNIETSPGTVLGTVGYMSPEQVRGQAVDARSDLFSLGAMLYEMVTGERAFRGESAVETMSAILKSDPLETIPTNIKLPSPLERIVRHLLEKSPDERYQSARDVAYDLRYVQSSGAEAVRTTSSTPRTQSVGREIAAWTIAAAALLVCAALVLRAFNSSPATAVHVSITLPAGYQLGEDDPLTPLPTRTPMVFTADGGALIFVATRAGNRQLFRRSLNRADVEAISGTEGARTPFVSPDGKWVGFWAANELRKSPMQGGAVSSIAEVRASQGPIGIAWGRNDDIIFGDERSGRIMRVSADGGTPTPITKQPVSTRRYALPYWLPGGKQFLFTDLAREERSDSRVMVQSLGENEEPREVMTSAADGRVLSTGHLVFMRMGTLMIVPFDPDRGEVRGTPDAALGGVMQNGAVGRSGAETAAGIYAVSSAGTLALVRGDMTSTLPSRMVRMSLDGRSTSAEPSQGAKPGTHIFPHISPDGSRALAVIQTPMRRELWLADWSRDTWTRLCPECGSPAIWSADGKRVLLRKDDALVVRVLDGSSPDQVLLRDADNRLIPGSWLADGRLVYESSPDMRDWEIRLWDPKTREAHTLIPYGAGRSPAVSPDGRWLAYDDAKEGEVVVQAFPGPGSRNQVSTGGGRNAAWSPDGKTLYYLRRTDEPIVRQALMAVDMSNASGTAGRPRELFRVTDFQTCAFNRCYDVFPDGQGFLMREVIQSTPEPVTRIDLVLNWKSMLEQVQ